MEFDKERKGSVSEMTPMHKLLLCATYMIYVLVNTVNGPLMPAMKSSIGFSSGQAATIAAIQTIAIGLGKVVWGGWPVDLCGARRTYYASMSLLACMVLLYSVSHSVHMVAAVAFAVEFFSTPIYACHVQFIRGWFTETKQAGGFWLLGIASRFGDVSSKLFYGELLSVIPWRWVTTLTSSLGFGGAVMCFMWHQDSRKHINNPTKPINLKFLKQTVMRMFVSSRFWLAASSLTATCMIKRTIEILGALFFKDIAPTLVTDSKAAIFACAWSAGLALSVLVGGSIFTKLSDKNKVVFMLITNAGSAALLFVVALLCVKGNVQSAAQLNLLVGLIFCAALGVGLPYYVPTGMFAIRFGKEDSGVVSAYMDAISFFASGAFIWLLRPVLDSRFGWSGAWTLMGIVGMAMTCINYFFLRMLLFELPNAKSVEGNTEEVYAAVPGADNSSDELSEFSSGRTQDVAMF
jgi:MFS family permease